MKVGACGFGVVTPLGSETGEVFRKIAAGERAVAVELANSETGRKLQCATVPSSATAHLGREPRLRRASGISLMAAAAGKAALAEAGVLDARNVAVVFGVSSGGVQYTRRFYDQVVNQGASAASPMLFPETVYNAPASHLAAMLGVDGATYTLTGDGTVGLQAAHFGAQLIAMGDAETVLVVAAEELDWILLEAHRDWRLLATGQHKGALLAEGAAAVVLRSSGPYALHSFPGQSSVTRAEGSAALGRAVRLATERTGTPDVLVTGENDTWADAAFGVLPDVADGRSFAPKRCLGEALGAGALIQLAMGAEALKQLPASRALIASLGWNQQAQAAVLEKSA